MTDKERYEAAAHAVQSGIAMLMNRDAKFTTPKHLRVGIDTTKADHGGLAALLIEKGIFTSEEYTKAMADAMEREKTEWEIRLSEMFGAKIVLA